MPIAAFRLYICVSDRGASNSISQTHDMRDYSVLAAGKIYRQSYWKSLSSNQPPDCSMKHATQPVINNAISLATWSGNSIFITVRCSGDCDDPCLNQDFILIHLIIQRRIREIIISWIRKIRLKSWFRLIKEISNPVNQKIL